MNADRYYRLYRDYRAIGYGRERAAAIADRWDRRYARQEAAELPPCPTCGGRQLVVVCDPEWLDPPEVLMGPCPACAPYRDVPPVPDAAPQAADVPAL